MSIALIANVTIPPLPAQYVTSRSSCQIAPTCVGSRPSSLVRRSPSRMIRVARDTSAAPVMASPQPVVPSLASIRTSVMCRVFPALFGSG